MFYLLWTQLHCEVGDGWCSRQTGWIVSSVWWYLLVHSPLLAFVTFFLGRLKPGSLADSSDSFSVTWRNWKVPPDFGHVPSTSCQVLFPPFVLWFNETAINIRGDIHPLTTLRFCPPLQLCALEHQKENLTGDVCPFPNHGGVIISENPTASKWRGRSD
jgi:hypothetical protein